jgi:hypothetical protein
MLNFREFIKEEDDREIAVIKISIDNIDLSKEETRDEINDTLFEALDDQPSTNPYGGWFRAAKILSLYGINLPKVIFKDILDGEEVVAISQFGEKVGAKLDGTISMKGDEEEYYFYYSYGINEDGYYDSYATVVDESGLNDLVSDDTEHLDAEGEKQPPQE